MMPRAALFVLLASNFVLGDAEVFELKDATLQLRGNFNLSFTMDLRDYALNTLTEVKWCRIVVTSGSTAGVRVKKLISGDQNAQPNGTVLHAPAESLDWRLNIFIENISAEDACLLFCSVSSKNETRRIYVSIEIAPPIESVPWYEQVFNITTSVTISCMALGFLALLVIQLGALREAALKKMSEKEGYKNYIFERTLTLKETAQDGNEESSLS